MICHMGSFPTIYHNEIRDITASLLTEVCHIMLLPSHPEHQQPCSAQYSCFWNNHQDAFFDVRVFYPNAPIVTVPEMPTGDTSKLKEGIRPRTKDQRDRAGSQHTPSPLNLGRNQWARKQQPSTNGSLT